jgi:hypothetical protein
MRRDTIKELFGRANFTMEQFWEAVEVMPDEFQGKPLKANISKYFKKNGDAKVKKQIGQEWADTRRFIVKRVGLQIHMNKSKKRKEAHWEIIAEKKMKTHRVNRDGNVVRRVSREEE